MLSLNPSLNLAPRLAQEGDAMSQSIERMSSGLRINRSSDDAAGLTIAETLRTQVMGSNAANRNIQEAINVVQIGEDGVGALLPIMQRMRELVVQAGNSTNAGTDLAAIQEELDQLKNELPTAFDTAHQFNIDLSANPAQRQLVFQVGANNGQTETVDYNALHDVLQSFTFQSFGYQELYDSPFSTQLQGAFGSPLPAPSSQAPPPFPTGVTLAQAFPKQLIVDPNTPANISQAFSVIDTTLQGLTTNAAYLGAASNRLQADLNNVTNYAINADAAQSDIRDTDMASQMTTLTKNQILQQSTVALVSQANMRPELLLQMLKQTG